jgi:general secretion pathway protein K
MKQDETGMALVSVLLIVALAAALLAIMLSGEDASLQRATRLTEAARARAIARGGEASAITALRRDLATAPASDDRSEAWAHIGDRETPIAGGRFSLAIADASGKLDLNPLVHGDPVTRQRLGVLASALGLPADSAQRITDLLAVTGPIADIAELAPAGLAPDAIAKLAAVTTALPAPAALNLNAAPEPVLALLVDNPMAAHALVGRRDRAGKLTAEDFAAEHARVPPGAGFTSRFYWVRVRVTIGDTAQQLASLLERGQGRNGGPRIAAIGRWQGNAIPAQAPAIAEN